MVGHAQIEMKISLGNDSGSTLGTSLLWVLPQIRAPYVP